MKVKVTKEIEAVYLSLSVAVRYGEEDMPNDAPLRNGDTWNAVIELSSHKILDWPLGKELSFTDMKVTSEGVYALLDADQELIVRQFGYVPNKILPGDFGDYLTLDIDADGVIKNWLTNPSLEDFEKSDER